LFAKRYRPLLFNAGRNPYSLTNSELAEVRVSSSHRRGIQHVEQLETLPGLQVVGLRRRSLDAIKLQIQRDGVLSERLVRPVRPVELLTKYGWNFLNLMEFSNDATVLDLSNVTYSVADHMRETGWLNAFHAPRIVGQKEIKQSLVPKIGSPYKVPMDPVDTGLQAGSVDLIFMYAGETMDDPEDMDLQKEILQETARILRPGGQFRLALNMLADAFIFVEIAKQLHVWKSIRVYDSEEGRGWILFQR